MQPKSAGSQKSTAKQRSEGAIKHTASLPLPTCALAAQIVSPQGRMLLWALEAGADLLPPSAVMGQRSAILEKPTNIDTIVAFAEESVKSACSLKNIYKSFVCLNADKHKGALKEEADDAPRGVGSILRSNGTTVDNEEDEGEGGNASAQFQLLHNLDPLALRRRYNKLQRERANFIDGGNNNDVDEPSPVTPTLRQHRERLQAAELALVKINKYVEQGPSYLLPLYKHLTASSVAVRCYSASPSGTSFAQNRTSLLRSSVSLKIRNAFKQEEQVTMLYAAFVEANARPSRQIKANAMTSNALKDKHAKCPSSGQPRVDSRDFARPITSGLDVDLNASVSARSGQHLQEFMDLSGQYLIPSVVEMQKVLADAIQFKNNKRIIKAVDAKVEKERQSRLLDEKNRIELKFGVTQVGKGGSSQEFEEIEEGADDEEETDKESTNSADEADKDFTIKDYIYIPEWYDAPKTDDSLQGPALDVQFNCDTGTLSVKFRLSDAQARALLTSDANNESAKEKPSAISTSTYLFQTEFIAIAADLWMGARGPWKGRMLHIARRAARPDGTSALVEPPYLGPLGRLLDERSGLSGSPAQTVHSPHQSTTTIDSIIIGQWCFTKLEDRVGGPDDPYRCTGCGNTRLSSNLAYVSDTRMKRGKYYCPFCRRSMTHVNVALASDPSAATKVAAWNREPFTPLPSHKAAPLVPPLKGPLPRTVNTKLHTMMGMTLI